MARKYIFKFICRSLALALVMSMLVQDMVMGFPDGVAGVSLTRPLVDNPYRIPRSVALTGESFAGGPNHSGPTVILVEDAHTNSSGQMNLAQTLKAVIDQQKLSVIFTEGSDRDVSLSDLRGWGSSQSRAAAALPFVRRGELKGSEYLELTADKDFAIVGVEDRALYDRAVGLYAAAARVRGKLKPALDRAEASILAVEAKLLNPRLAEFHAATRAYGREELSTAEYFSLLMARAVECGVLRSDLRQLERLEKIREIERTLDYAKASQAWSDVVSSLPQADRTSLGMPTLGKLCHGNFEEMAAAGPRLQKALGTKGAPAALKIYLRYLHEMEGLDPHALLAEADRIERLVEERLAVLPAEIRVLRMERSLGFLRDLTNLTLTPQGYAYLQSAGNDADLQRIAAFLNGQIMNLGLPAERALLLEEVRMSDIKAARDFYQSAFERDDAFLKNLMTAAREQKVPQAVLITGGFHTPHLTQMMRERGISYQILTPQVYEETNRNRYEKLLLAQAPRSSAKLTASALITPYTTETPGARLALEKAFQILPITRETQSSSNAVQFAPIGARMAENGHGDERELKASAPMVSLSIRDLGAVSVPSEQPGQPATIGVDMLKGLKAARLWLQDLHRQGIGRVYLVGLASTGEMSGLTQSDGREHGESGPVFYYGNPNNNGVGGEVAGWPKKHFDVDGHQLDDKVGQNVFSVMDMRLIHEGSIPPASTHEESQRILEAELKALIVDAKALGIDVYVDFIPWLAPESITADNYKSMFWREPTPEEAASYAKAVAEEKRLYPGGHGKRSEDAKDPTKLTPTEIWTSNILKIAGPYIAVRIPEAGGGEKLIFVRRANIGIDSEDQVVPNPYHPDTLRYYTESLRRFADLGVAGVRVDLGFRLLPGFVRPYFDEMRDHLAKRGQSIEKWMRLSGITTLRSGEKFESWWERQKNTNQPMRDIISVTRSYAREFDFMIEVYPHQDGEQKEFVASLGVDHVYDDALFQALLHTLRNFSEALPAALRGIWARSPHGTVYFSNFDEDSLKRLLAKFGHPQAITACNLMLAVLPRMGIPVLVTEREMQGKAGSVVSTTGGSDSSSTSFHPGPDPGELTARFMPGWETTALRDAELPKLMRLLQEKLGPRSHPREVWIPQNTSQKNRLVPMFWRDAQDVWYLAVADLYPEYGPNIGFGPGRIKIELDPADVPAGLDVSIFTGEKNPHQPESIWSQSPFWRMGVGDWIVKGSKPTLDIDVHSEDFSGFNMVMRLGPAKVIPSVAEDSIRSAFGPSKTPRARERAMLRLLRHKDAQAVKALWVAMSFPKENMRLQAANILARRSLVSVSPQTDPDEFIHMLMEPADAYKSAGLEIPEGYLAPDGYPGKYAPEAAHRWLTRNGRYSVLHTLKHLSWLARGQEIEQNSGDAEYARRVIGAVRDRLASEVGQWTSKRNSALSRTAVAAIHQTKKSRWPVEWDRDFGVGSKSAKNLIEILRLVVLRSQIIQNKKLGRRDTFYWVLDAVKEIVPDVAGDPVAEVVYRGKVVPAAPLAADGAGARMATELGRARELWSVLKSSEGSVDDAVRIDAACAVLFGGRVVFEAPAVVGGAWEHQDFGFARGILEDAAAGEEPNKFVGIFDVLGIRVENARLIWTDPTLQNPYYQTMFGVPGGAEGRIGRAVKDGGIGPQTASALLSPVSVFRPRLIAQIGEERRAFQAIRVIHNVDLGPGKGGIRVVNSQLLEGDDEFMKRFKDLRDGKNFNLAELKYFLSQWLLQEDFALAPGMTDKDAAAGLPYGGAKGILSVTEVAKRADGLLVLRDVTSGMSPEEANLARKKAFRVLTASLYAAGLIGPRKDVPAPDMGSSATDMDVIADEYLYLYIDDLIAEAGKNPATRAEDARILESIKIEAEADRHALGLGWPAGASYLKAVNGRLRELRDRRQRLVKGSILSHLAAAIATVTSKTSGLGGSAFRPESTGVGVHHVLKNVMRAEGKIPAKTLEEYKIMDGMTAKLEGFGGVGIPAAYAAVKDGVKLTAIRDLSGVIVKEAGLSEADLKVLEALKKSPAGFEALGKQGFVIEGAVFNARGEASDRLFMEHKAQIYYACAKENSVTADSAAYVAADIIVEGANGAVASSAYEKLASRGVLVIPDTLANAGGVIVSYFEWVQNITNRRWTARQVEARMKRRLDRSVRSADAVRQEPGIQDWRLATDILAFRRVDAAANGARMAEEDDEVKDALGRGPLLVELKTVFRESAGIMHVRPAAAISQMAKLFESEKPEIEKHYSFWIKRNDGTLVNPRSINQLMESEIWSGEELTIQFTGHGDPGIARELAFVFSQIMNDKDYLSNPRAHEERKQAYQSRIDEILQQQASSEATNKYFQHMQSEQVERFIEEVLLGHPSEVRGHLAIESEDGVVAVFRVWRDGQEVWYALKGQTGRRKISLMAPSEIEGLAGHVPQIYEATDTADDHKLNAAAAVALDASLAEDILRLIGEQFPGVDLTQRSIAANVELDAEDLIDRAGSVFQTEYHEQIMRNLRALQTKIRDAGLGRLLFEGDQDALSSAPTVRLYHPQNTDFKESASKDTLLWSYDQGTDEILPVLSSTILSALVAAVPEEDRADYLAALTPLYQRLTGSSEPLTPALLEEVRAGRRQLAPIKPLTLRGYLDAAVYLQELSRKSTVLSA